jgi:hypothetical protein
LVRVVGMLDAIERDYPTALEFEDVRGRAGDACPTEPLLSTGAFDRAMGEYLKRNGLA